MAESVPVPPAQAEHVEERHARTRKALYTEIEHRTSANIRLADRLGSAEGLLKLLLECFDGFADNTMEWADVEPRVMATRAFLSGKPSDPQRCQCGVTPAACRQTKCDMGD